MSLEEGPKLVPDPALLPKSVKVRSTCNACQQAKIRCSHEKPSCQRCQKQKMECIYSMSRRLGRPSKKSAVSPPDSPEGVEEKNQAPKRRRVTKRKNSTKKPAEIADTTGETLQSDDNLDISSIEESCLLTPTLPDPMTTNGTASVEDCFDFASDDWLHMADYAQEMEWFGSLHHSDSKSESAFRAACGDFDGYTALSAVPAILSDDLGSAASFFDLGSFSHGPKNDLYLGMHTAAEKAGLRKSCENQALTTEIFGPCRGSSDRGFDCTNNCAFGTLHFGDLDLDQQLSDIGMGTTDSILDFVKTDGDLDPGEVRSPYACDCYKSATRGMLELSACTDPSAHTPTIVNLLKCQKSLNQLARQLTQCTTCPRRRQSYLLVITMVGIDELLTSFEEFVFSERGIYEQWPNGNDTVWNFGGHIQTCQVSIGEFQVSFEEKTSFIKQVLYSRIAALCATVRQVRLHAEQEFSSTYSRGKLTMMREVDRRLELLLRRIKLLRS